MIALLNLSVLGFSFVFHDKAKRTQQGDLLHVVQNIATGRGKSFAQSAATQFAEGAPFNGNLYKSKYVLSRP